MFAKPQAEHEWLMRLVGEWAVESECQMGPDQPPQKGTSHLTCRTLGGLWLIGEGKALTPEGDDFSSIMTLGYDPSTSALCGNFYRVDDDAPLALLGFDG